MKILHAYRTQVVTNYRGVPRVEKVSVSESQMKKDALPLKAAYEKMCREEPTAAFFGGTIRVGNRHYQVA